MTEQARANPSSLQLNKLEENLQKVGHPERLSRVNPLPVINRSFVDA